MAHINKTMLTKLEIIRVATRKFLEQGYSNTSIKAICNELEMSTGNLTFHFPTKEHLLAELTQMLCRFQQKMMDQEADEGLSSIMAVCLELSSMAVMCENSEIAKDFYLSTYSSPLSLDIIRKNDMKRAKQVFQDYCEGWSEEQFKEAEILVSGMEYATLMTTGDPASLETRIAGAIDGILNIYGVPEEIRKIKVEKLFALNYLEIGNRVLHDFKIFVEKVNEQAFLDLLS